MVVLDCTSDAIALLQPRFEDDVHSLLLSSSYEWHIVYGYRSIALQTELYKKYQEGGPLAAPPGHSAHNFGLAVDVQLWVPGEPTQTSKRMEWNVKHPGWQWLFDAVKKHPRLHSGLAFGDFDHIERYNWREFKDWRKWD